MILLKNTHLNKGYKMDFIIMLGFKFLFDLLWPAPKPIKSSISQDKSDKVAAAFWFGTSYENLNKTNNPTENFSNDSEYDQTW